MRTLLTFFLIKKSNKKNKGFRKMAKNYAVNLSPANSLRRFVQFETSSGSNNAGSPSPSEKDGLLHNFLSAIFLKQGSKAV
jgi:hypothetical protein